MADNSEIIVGGGQAVKPDQATIDALIEKLKEKLMAREMIQERIDALLAKYRESLPRWLTLTHKYITLYPLPTGNADYNRDYATIYTDKPVFEEVNWSAVDYPEERPDEYRLSRRLSNMYHYTDDPNYKFPDVDTTIEEEELKWTFNEETGEYEQVPRTMIYKADAAGIIDRYDQSTSFRLATFNHNDDIRKIFFLEIVWGYSGWEWHDYDLVIGTDPEIEEPITETLKGGNLYKIKEIETVPHIIDGFRLYHINDFLNSQNKVTTVEEFDTVHIKAMNRAFKRLTRKYGLNTITPLLLKVYEFPEVIEADDAFCNNKISVVDNHTIYLPKLINTNGFYKWGEFIDGTTFRLDSLEKFTSGFRMAYFSQTDFNLNDILIGNSLKKVNDLSYLLYCAVFANDREETGYDKPVNTFTIDLSGSSLSATDEFNLNNLAFKLSAKYQVGGTTSSLTRADRYFIFDITLKGLTDLSNAFRNILAKTRNNNNTDNFTVSDVSGIYWNIGATNMEVNFNGTEGLIRNLDYAFADNTYLEAPPKLRNSGGTMINAWANDYTFENYIYFRSSLREGITYDFSPNLVLNSSIGQFNNCTISLSKTVDNVEVPLPFTFTNVDALKSVRFQNISFGTHTETVDDQTVTVDNSIPFPFVGDFHSSRYQYNEDASDLHRYINFSGSKFSSIRTVAGNSEQTIYVTGNSAATMFNGCTEIDFCYNGDYTQPMNITIDMSATVRGSTGVTWSMFQDCRNMVRTPKLVNANLVSGANGGDNFNNLFTNCVNLEYVDGLDFKDARWTNARRMMNFSTCTKLRYLILGDVGGAINLRNCFDLDIPTLYATLMRQTHFGNTNAGGGYGNEGLVIEGTVYDTLVSTYNDFEPYLQTWPDRFVDIIRH